MLNIYKDNFAVILLFPAADKKNSPNLLLIFPKNPAGRPQGRPA